MKVTFKSVNVEWLVWSAVHQNAGPERIYNPIAALGFSAIPIAVMGVVDTFEQGLVEP